MDILLFSVTSIAATAYRYSQLHRRHEASEEATVCRTKPKSFGVPSPTRMISQEISSLNGSMTPTLEQTSSDASLSTMTGNSPRSGVRKSASDCAIPTTVSITRHDSFVPILEAAGGTDKDATGHRRDTMPIRDALVRQGCKSLVLQYQEENTNDEAVNETARAHNDALRSLLLGHNGAPAAAGIIVRCNPGTLSRKTQAKLDALLVEMDQCGTKVLSHPEVIQRMGAKDALTKIRHLKCGLEDTYVYYDEASLIEGFTKSIAFRPRVIKQNRGSQGEGIWICKLKDESQYCKTFGEKVASLDTPLILLEANDNHVEEHTVGEFLDFCIHGRRPMDSTVWQSSGQGKYLEGGVEQGAMLVDQRFLPRIVEGEVRCLMVGPNLVELLHKKPKSGGLSATLQSGAIYTTYPPTAPEFANLIRNFEQDMPHMMAAFGMEDQPLPLLWTADYIFGDKDEHGQDTFFIGEFNCSCVGITQGLDRAEIVAVTAVESVLPSGSD